MLKPGRVNIIDLSDLDSPTLRNLAIAQVLRQLADPVPDAVVAIALASDSNP